MTPADSIAAIETAARELAEEVAEEMALADARPLIKAAAIKRLMESGAATSATAAEKIVEQDAEYAAHRVKERECVVRKIAAQGAYEAAKRTADLAIVNHRFVREVAERNPTFDKHSAGYVPAGAKL